MEGEQTDLYYANLTPKGTYKLTTPNTGERKKPVPCVCRFIDRVVFTSIQVALQNESGNSQRNLSPHGNVLGDISKDTSEDGEHYQSRQTMCESQASDIACRTNPGAAWSLRLPFASSRRCRASRDTRPLWPGRQ